MTNPTGPHIPGAPKYQQHNIPAAGGVVNANQGTQINNIYGQSTPGQAPVAKGVRRDTKVLLVLLAVDVAWFFYGMLAYTGLRDNTGDMVRAVGFFILFGLTIRLFVGWLRRRLH